MDGLEQIKKYQEFILVFPSNTPHPSETIEAFKRFGNDNSIVFSVQKKITEDSVHSGQAYFVIKDDDLVNIIKRCKQIGLKPGTDIGVISYNDAPMKEIVGAGITVISTDFKEMGRKAAAFVSGKEKIHEQIPTKLILRGSL